MTNRGTAETRCNLRSATGVVEWIILSLLILA
jgi:hypothetical protein